MERLLIRLSYPGIQLRIVLENMNSELKNSMGTETDCGEKSRRIFFLRRTIKLYFISQIAALFCKTQNQVIDQQCLRSVFLGNTSFMEKNAILRICSSPCFSNMKTFTIDKGTGKDTREIPKHLKTVYCSNCTADSRKAVEAFEQKHFKANS